MRSRRLRVSVLILSLAIMFSGIMIAWGVQNNFGGIYTSEVNLLTDEGIIIHGTLQVPVGVSNLNPAPGVVAIHGFASTNEMMRAFSIELTRRGCVVLSIDAANHGDSDPSAGPSTDRGGAVAVEYLAALPFVNKIGMIGHSMGAGICLQTVLNSSVEIDAVALIAGGVGYSNANLFNATSPKNVLVAIGAFDELIPIPQILNTLNDPFNTAAPVQVGQFYGNFTQGTARQLISSPSNHLTELIEPYLVSETVGWFENSFRETPTDPAWISKTQLVYPLFSVGGFLGILGLFLSVFPVFLIILETNTFQRLKTKETPSPSISRKTHVFLTGVYGLIGLASFPILAFIGFSLPLPQAFSGGFGVWLLGSGMIALLVLFGLTRKKQWSSGVWESFGIDPTDLKRGLSTFGYHAILALAVIGWLVLWVYVFDWLLIIDFRAYIPVLKNLSLLRALMVPLYLVFTIPFFVIEGMWITGLLRPTLSNTKVISLIKWGVKTSFTKLAPYLLLFAAQYLPTLIVGNLLIQGYLGFVLLFLFTSILLFGVTSLFIAWSKYLTGRVYSGAIISAILLSWSLASILPFSL